jgi:hypothetical protein
VAVRLEIEVSSNTATPSTWERHDLVTSETVTKHVSDALKWAAVHANGVGVAIIIRRAD